MNARTIRGKACVALVVLALCLAGPAMAASTAEAKDPLKASPEDMRWWREARFGLFVHWGPVSLKGTEIGWSRGGERRGRRGRGVAGVEVPNELYGGGPAMFGSTEVQDVVGAAERGVQLVGPEVARGPRVHDKGLAVIDPDEYHVCILHLGRGLQAQGDPSRGPSNQREVNGISRNAPVEVELPVTEAGVEGVFPGGDHAIKGPWSTALEVDHRDLMLPTPVELGLLQALERNGLIVTRGRRRRQDRRKQYDREEGGP